MKPILTSENGKSANFAVVMPPQNQETVTIKQTKNIFVRRVVIGTLAFAVITAVVIGCVFFGIKSARDTYKESLVQFRTKSGLKIYEKITVTDNEEVFETPGITAIYDFSTNLMLFKEASEHTCYVSHFKTEDVELPGDLYNNLTTTEMSVELDDPVTRKYQSTGIEVTRDQLSERGRELCRTNKVFWVVDDTSVSRDRRAAAGSSSTSGSDWCICLCCNCCNNATVAPADTSSKTSLNFHTSS